MNIVKRVDRLEKLWKSMSISIEKLTTKFENLEQSITEHEARLDVNEHHIDQTEEKINKKGKEWEEKVVNLDNEWDAKFKNDENKHKKEILSLRKELDNVSNKIVKIDEDIILLDDQAKKISENMKKVNEKNHRFKRPTEKCEHCEEIFETKSDLENHMVEIGLKENHKCNKCESVFISEWRLKKHIETHIKNKKIRNCHYYNSGKSCPFEKLGCKFMHRYSAPCKNGQSCDFKMCQFKHL